MKHIIIEGGDCLGKDTLIKGICNHLDYNNITIRHFGKPPKNLPQFSSSSDFQGLCFRKEANLLSQIYNMETDIYNYFENTVIWNRSHIGEYVYSQMFRDRDKKEVTEYINNYELNHLSRYDTKLILLTADPEFFLKQEDGNSFSQNLEQKTKELNLFKEIFDKSNIEEKLLLKVNNNKNIFLPKEEILETIIGFLKI